MKPNLLSVYPYNRRFVAMVFALVILVLMTSIYTARAQNTAVLTVDRASGTVTSGSPCPTPRDTAIYTDIQAAVTCALHGDTLNIAAGTYIENLIIDKNLIITGMRASETTVDAGGNGSVITVANGVTVTLSALTITGGNANFGGGIFTNAGHVEIIDSIITGNAAITAGGGVFTRAGSVTIINSTVADNQPAGDGGGIFTRAGTVTIENSTISGHLVSGLGGGVGTAAGTVSMTNTTVSGNQAVAGGGIESDAGTVTLGNVTVADNSSGIVAAQGVVNVGNTLLASNNNAPCSGTLTSDGYNVLAALPGNCVITGNTAGNVTGIDPKLGVLKDNGGATQTQALLEGSPALDAGIGCASTDQRGAARPQGVGCDVGAYEGIRGDCNADTLVSDEDVSALNTEIFDGDGSDPASVPNPTFSGDSVGCNANADPVVDAGDISCVALILSEGPGSCQIAIP